MSLRTAVTRSKMWNRATLVATLSFALFVQVDPYYLCLSDNDCVNGLCWRWNSNVCLCRNGFYGPQCQYRYTPQWGPWSSCDVTCGGGQRKRVQTVSQSTSQTQSQPCGQTCIHGSFTNNICVCPPGYKGSCCEVAPVCQSPCRNGGTCVGDDMCRCPDGFYGLQCEIGSHEIPERMKPRLNTVIDPGIIFNNLSWYDGPNVSDFNRVCFIKVASVNAPYDAILTAISYRDLTNGSTVKYGNYSAGPIDANATLTGQLRFACLQVRCPGWTLDGTSFNVNVDVKVQSGSGQCNVTSNQRGILLTTYTNRMSFTLVEGDNYGPLYGIYYASGYRDRAEYLSKHVCYSGRQYDFANLNPSIGVLATLICN